MAKISRNAPCSCGSGKRYKKCCLYNKVDQVQQEKTNRLAFVERFKNQHKDTKITWAHSEDIGIVKMSEVLVDFADELLSQADTKKTEEKAIMMAICAWNLALIKKSKRKSKTEDFMKIMNVEKGSQDWHDASQILAALIDKKETKYASINRYILGFEFTDTKRGLHLNVISTQTPND